MNNYQDILQPTLASFASSYTFTNQISEIFGENNDYSLLQQSWLDGTFSLPTIEIVSSSEINGALGAYAGATDTIYLSQELVDSGNNNLITRVLLEEYGHYIDDVFNTVDTLGDEGEYFASVVLGDELSQTKLTRLQTEDDTATVVIDGQEITIEQAIRNGTTTTDITNNSQDEVIGNDVFTIDDTYNYYNGSGLGNSGYLLNGGSFGSDINSPTVYNKGTIHNGYNSGYGTIYNGTSLNSSSNAYIYNGYNGDNGNIYNNSSQFGYNTYGIFNGNNSNGYIYNGSGLNTEGYIYNGYTRDGNILNGRGGRRGYFYNGENGGKGYLYNGYNGLTGNIDLGDRTSTTQGYSYFYNGSGINNGTQSEGYIYNGSGVASIGNIYNEATFGSQFFNGNDNGIGYIYNGHEGGTGNIYNDNYTSIVNGFNSTGSGTNSIGYIYNGYGNGSIGNIYNRQNARITNLGNDASGISSNIYNGSEIGATGNIYNGDSSTGAIVNAGATTSIANIYNGHNGGIGNIYNGFGTNGIGRIENAVTSSTNSAGTGNIHNGYGIGSMGYIRNGSGTGNLGRIYNGGEFYGGTGSIYNGDGGVGYIYNGDGGTGYIYNGEISTETGYLYNGYNNGTGYLYNGSVSGGVGYIYNYGTIENSSGSSFINYAGSVIVNNASSFVDRGVIINNGTFTNEGTLAGHGRFIGNLSVSAGIIAPGGSTTSNYTDTDGTFTVEGDFSQSGTGVISLSVGSLSSSDKLNITGTANINGGSIEITGLDILDTSSWVAATTNLTLIDGNSDSDATGGLTIDANVFNSLVTAVNAYDDSLDSNSLNVDFEVQQTGDDLILQVIATENTAPTVANSIPLQSATGESLFSFTFAENTFNDADGDNLSYTATLSDGSDLSTTGWLTFDDTNRTFSGTPLSSDVGTIIVTITATDTAGASVSTDFTLAVGVGANGSYHLPIPFSNGDQTTDYLNNISGGSLYNGYNGIYDLSQALFNGEGSNGTGWIKNENQSNFYNGFSNGLIGLIANGYASGVGYIFNRNQSNFYNGFDIGSEGYIYNSRYNQIISGTGYFTNDYSSNFFNGFNGSGYFENYRWLTNDYDGIIYNGYNNGSTGEIRNYADIFNGNYGNGYLYNGHSNGGVGSFYNEGNFYNNSGGLIQNEVGSYFENTSLISNYGKFINNGTLDNTGTFTNYAGAILAGSGTVNGSLVLNAGTFAPGGITNNNSYTDTENAFTINGDLTQSGTASIQLSIAGITSFDQLIVTGNTAINGGSIEILGLGAIDLSALTFGTTSLVLIDSDSDNDTTGDLTIDANTLNSLVSAVDTYDNQYDETFVDIDFQVEQLGNDLVLQITKTSLNTPPTVVSAIVDQTATENSSFSLNISSNFSDSDVGDNLTYSTNNLPSWLSFDGSTGIFSGTPTNTNIGSSISVTVTATDNAGVSVSDTFAISVINAGNNVTYDSNTNTYTSNNNNDVIVVANNYTSDTITFVQNENQSANSSVTIKPIENPSPTDTPTEVDTNFGFYDVNLSNLTQGEATTVTLYLPEGSTANTYWKYGPTPDNNTPHWYEFIYDPATNTGAKFQDINGDGQNEIILHFVDGLRGDDDLTVNGIIVDPGTPGETSNVAPYVNIAIADQEAALNGTFDFTFDVNTFNDADGDTLTYAATLADNSDLSTIGLTFDSATRTFGGSPTSTGSFDIKVTADDGNGGTVEDTFTLEVYPILFTDSGQTLGNTRSEGVALGDFDGDGDLDAFEVNRASGGNVIWINDGNGNFTTGQTIASSTDYAVSLGDIDGDGDIDALVVNNSNSRIWLNDGTGNFTNSNQTISGGWDANLADLDGDGDLDAFTVSLANSSKVWFNDGNGNFTDSGQNIGTPSQTPGLKLGDLDGDGDLDAFLGYSGLPNEVWFNDGNGNFTNSGQTLGNKYSYGIELGDLDGDGDLDAFVANNGYQGNTVWFNDGSGVFTDSGQSLGNSVSYEVSLGDFDGDGDLDAFVANAGNSPANKIWLNDGNGVFTDSGLNLGNDESRSVSVGDLDGDGDLDAFFVNDQTGTANQVFFNETPHAANVAPTVANPISNLTIETNSTFEFVFAKNTFADTNYLNESFTDAYIHPFTYTATLENGDPLPSWLAFDSATRTFSSIATPTTDETLIIKVMADDGFAGTVDETFELNVVTPIMGSSSSETMNGTASADIIHAQEGNDNVNSSEGADVLDGGDGIDRANYANSSAGVNVNLQTGKGSGGNAEGDVLNSIERLSGSSYNDHFIGNNERNYFYAGNGDDIVEAGDGGAYIYGQNGNDDLRGGAGDDRIYGQGGDDSLSGGNGKDILKGWTGNDTISGGGGNDLIYGDSGVDTITGADENTLGVGEIDTIYGGSEGDLFILGNTTGAFYDDGNSLSNGISDYARIRDYNQAENTIQLYGGQTYYLGTSPSGVASGTGIYIDSDGSGSLTSQDELIGLLEGVSLASGQITVATQGFSLVS